MAIHSVLKVPQSEPDSFILTQVKSVGSKPLDLKLIGTEGENPYVGRIHHDQVPSLKVNNSPVNDDEWRSILESFFQQQPVESIQATATVQSEKSISITFRKEVQGITQRLGAITLNYDPDEAIELFDWCATASEAALTSNTSAVASSNQISRLEASVKQLKDQLDELIKAKETDESVQLQKFCDLLNEKKVKIREQQKIMASGSFKHTAKPTDVDMGEDEVPHKRKPKSSRPGKRKATNKNPASPETGNEDDNMQVELPEPVVKTEPQDSDDGETTDRTASADESEEESERNDVNIAENNTAPTKSAAEGNKKTAHQPPPRRDLPFLNKQPAKQAPVAEDTDSDDEL